VRRALAAVLMLFAFAGATAVGKLAEQLGDSSDDLKAGKYAEALKLDDNVIREMGEYYVSGAATTQFFTIAVVHKALACAGLGRNDEALWYWHTAISLFPAVAKSDMSDYGAAGAFLREHTTRAVAPPQEAELNPPTIVKRIEPKWPSKTVNNHVEGTIVIEFVIDADGKPSNPRIVDDIGAPMLAYATAEAVHQWTFRPATVNGKPVATNMQLGVKYRVR
jgi:TonB family protein